MEPEEVIAQRLTRLFLQNHQYLPYVNLDKNNTYLGWVSDFHFEVEGRLMKLDLNQENDLFLLFVLSVVWSRPGQWENSAYFVTYLKSCGKISPYYWLTQKNIDYELNVRQDSASSIAKKIKNHKARKRVAFRKDIFKSLHVLATHWAKIKEKLKESSENNDFLSFMTYLRSIKGLGVNDKQILIKIPLILRELRCQKIYENIPGKYCSVPDQRVLDSAAELGIQLVRPYNNAKTNINALVSASRKLYSLFGDLYDLPLFAYEDLKKYE